MASLEQYGSVYTRHIRNATTLNEAIGGGAEIEIGKAQAAILRDAGVVPARKLLEIGFGSGRIWHGLSDLLSLEAVEYYGIDVVPDVLEPVSERLSAIGLAEEQFTLKVATDTADYPFGYGAEALWGFSVFTHVEVEDILCILRALRDCASREALGLFTFLPLEHEFGRHKFEAQAKRSFVSRVAGVRDVAITKEMAVRVAELAGWRTVSAHWSELDNPFRMDGSPEVNQSWLVLTPVA